MSRRAPRGFANQNGASFCHYCGKQLTWKTGGGFHFVTLLTPGDRLPVRVHKTICPEQAMADGYKEQANANDH